MPKRCEAQKMKLRSRHPCLHPVTKSQKRTRRKRSALAPAQPWNLLLFCVIYFSEILAPPSITCYFYFFYFWPSNWIDFWWLRGSLSCLFLAHGIWGLTLRTPHEDEKKLLFMDIAQIMPQDSSRHARFHLVQHVDKMIFCCAVLFRVGAVMFSSTTWDFM